MKNLLLPLALATALVATLAPALAAPPADRRLVIDVSLQREGPWQSGAEQGRSRLTQQLVLSAVLRSDGVEMLNNPLDPDDTRRQMENAQRRSGMPDPAQMQARAQAIQARCGSDQACLMREAMAMTRLEPVANAGFANDAAETPYLHFNGKPACGLDVTMRIDEQIEGRFMDVQGWVPFTETVKADDRQRDDALCPLLQTVLDTRNGRLWAHPWMAVKGPRGTSTRVEKNRTPRTGNGVMLRWHEAEAWLQGRLLKLDTRGGSDRFQQALPGGGRVEVKLAWRFEPA